jgi:hypothetical protein
MSLAPTALVPQRTDNNSGTSPCSSYEFTRTIRMSREELRIQRLHEMAVIFEDAFDSLEVRP